MFNIGISEIILLGILAVILVNPKELPKVMQKVGRILGSIRQYKDALEKELNSLERLSHLDESDKKREDTERDRHEEEKDRLEKE